MIVNAGTHIGILIIDIIAVGKSSAYSISRYMHVRAFAAISRWLSSIDKLMLLSLYFFAD